MLVERVEKLKAFMLIHRKMYILSKIRCKFLIYFVRFKIKVCSLDRELVVYWLTWPWNYLNIDTYEVKISSKTTRKEYLSLRYSLKRWMKITLIYSFIWLCPSKAMYSTEPKVNPTFNLKMGITIGPLL